ncbi:hypothetical protein SAMN05216436_11125 [bacterium A37T11]|nr:hypothetical protein SAMN05216436_11125 [bacterium A37T11]
MKTNKLLVCLAALLLMLSNCKKEKPQMKPDPGEAQTVSFHLSGFKTEINPLSSAKATLRPLKLKSATNGQHLNISPGSDPQFVYFWSFNQSNLLPDIAADDGAEITFVAKEGSSASFPAGYKYEDDDILYEAGQSFSTIAPTSIKITIPAAKISNLSNLSFSTGGSGTGPKDFSISYSSDGGESYAVISATNPFTNFSSSGWNHYSFDLSSFSNLLASNSLILKIEPIPANTDYNPNSGTFRIDNIRLTGIYTGTSGPDNPENPATVSNIHYYIFDSVADTLEASGTTAYDLDDTQPSLAVQLSPGTYSAVFLSNVSDQELRLPTSLHAITDFYAGNYFDNDQAVIFGTKVDDIVVSDGPIEKEAALSRFYSNIAFHFTDATGLTSVKKIEVSRVHANFWYNPFSAGSLPDDGINKISFTDPFVSGVTLSFNEFLGTLTTAQPISYTINAYDAGDQLLRTFTVSSAIKNNVQVSFTGQLLTVNNGPNGDFGISFNTDWDTPVDENF